MEIGSKGSIKSNGISGNVSQSNGNLNTEGTNYQNGNFVNVNEVHNNTGSMIISGFNQDGGKLIGNIGKVEVTSKQNTSTTTGSSKGMSIGVSSQGIPTSVNVNASKTNGNRNFVDNQSSFTVGEGSNLQVGTLENTGAIIGKQSENATFKIDNYVGKNLQNDDEMKTTGGAIGVSTGKPKVTSLEFSQDSRDKEGVTRNTVVGNVEIGQASGDEINRDLSKANEVTKDSRSSTNVSVESQTIEYATDSGKLKEDLGKAKDEIEAIGAVTKATIATIGSKEQNSFLDFLKTERLQETIRNIGYIDTKNKTKDEIVKEMKDKYGEIFKQNGKELEVNFYVNSEVSSDDPRGEDKRNSAGFLAEDGSIWLNADNISSINNFNLNSVFTHEGTHKVTGKNTELLANYGEARASKFIEESMDKGYLSKIGGGLNWKEKNLTEEQKDRLAGYRDIEKKEKIKSYFVKFNIFLDEETTKIKSTSKDKELISKIEKEIQKKYGIENFKLSDEIEEFDLKGKELFAQDVTNSLKTELENKLIDYKKASGDNKKKIGEEIIQKYGISNSDLATAEKNVSEIIKGTILKSSNAENNLKEILNNKNLNDDEKVKEIDRKFGISITIDDLKNNSQVSQDIIKNASLERIVAQDTDKIANKMRWESQFFKDYIANTQKSTNRPIVIDEDDFIWFVNKDGKLDPEFQIQDNESEIIPKGKISFITEKYIEEKDNKIRIKDSFQPENVIQKDKSEIITENPIVWKTKNLQTGNEIIESIIKSKKVNTVFHVEDPKKIGVLPSEIKNIQNFEGSDTFLLMSFDNSKITYNALERYDETKIPIVKQEKSLSYQILLHERDHVKKMQDGTDKGNIPVYEIYRDSSGELHFSGEKNIENISIQNQTPSKIVNSVIEKLYEEYEEKKGQDKRNDEIIENTLNELKNKKTELYKYFYIEVEEKYKKAQKSKKSFINVNAPFSNTMNMSEKEAIETETKGLHEQGIKSKDRVIYQ